ncbi:hypothetical protein ACRAQ6_11340 [Erythrobacter sp. HA6-11]
MIDDLLVFFGGLGLGTIALVSTAYALFKWFGKKWIEQQFQESLESFRHEKAREIESLRADLNAQFDRATIVNQREFEILPSLYRLLNEAHGSVASFTSAFQLVPDVNRMREPELDELFDQKKFAAYEREDVRASGDKASEFRKIVFWKDYNMARAPFVEFNNYLITNSIFIDDELLAEVEIVRDLMLAALQEARFEHEHPNPRPDRWKARDELSKQGREAIDKIRNEVKKSLSKRTESS